MKHYAHTDASGDSVQLHSFGDGHVLVIRPHHAPTATVLLQPGELLDLQQAIAKALHPTSGEVDAGGEDTQPARQRLQPLSVSLPGWVSRFFKSVR